MWNPHSVMFEVGWCVTLYSTVLLLEFLPPVFERLRWQRPLRALRVILIPVVIAGVILSTLHQSSLGSLYLIVPTKLHPLWYSPLLPVLFFVSAIVTGLAMTIFESWHSSKAFGRRLEAPLLSRLGRIMGVMLMFYLAMRLWDLARRGALVHLGEARLETYLFIVEIALMLIPMLLMFRQHVRNNPMGLYVSAVMAVLGFVANRLNVSIAGMEAGSGAAYWPKWTEIAVTLAIIAAGFAIFRMAAKHLPIFEEEHGHAPSPARVIDREYQPAMAGGD
jgi:Ni/Fe-hydrogenase subunit HybB-like protein